MEAAGVFRVKNVIGEKGMKGSSEIYMDFKRARQAAEELENLADLLRRISKADLQQIIQQLSATWICPEAEMFCKKEEQLRFRVEEIQAEMYSIAKQIRQDARRIYEAEMRAYEIASRRE